MPQRAVRFHEVQQRGVKTFGIDSQTPHMQVDREWGYPDSQMSPKMVLPEKSWHYDVSGLSDAEDVHDGADLSFPLTSRICFLSPPHVLD